MTGIRGLIEPLGGPYVLSRWSWIIAAPISVIAGSRYDSSPSWMQFAAWTGVLIAVAIALALPMWLLAAVLGRVSEGIPRAVAALGGFALLGVLRAVLLQVAHEATHLGSGLLADRLAISISGSIVTMTLIAVIVNDYRTDASVVTRLTQAQRTLAHLAEREAELLDSADRRVLDEVRAALAAELGAEGADSARIRRVVDSIVRPLSHRLVTMQDELTAAALTPPGETAPITLVGALRRVRAPSALKVAVAIEATVVGTVLVTTSPLVALANVVIGGVLIFIGGRAISLLVRLAFSPALRLAVTIALYASLGALVATIMSLVLSWLWPAFPNFWFGVMVGTSAAAGAVSIWEAIADGRKARQDALVQAITDEAQMVERLRDAVARRRGQAADFLHSTVQAELVAAALRGVEPATVSESLAELFGRYGQAEARPASEQFAGLLTAWSEVLDLHVDVDPDFPRAVDAKSSLGGPLIDALSEALTNVVRHSPNRSATVRVHRLGERWCLSVTSMGTLDSRQAAGIGLARLREKGVDIQLATAGADTVLTATV